MPFCDCSRAPPVITLRELRRRGLSRWSSGGAQVKIWSKETTNSPAREWKNCNQKEQFNAEASRRRRHENQLHANTCWRVVNHTGGAFLGCRWPPMVTAGHHCKSEEEGLCDCARAPAEPETRQRLAQTSQGRRRRRRLRCSKNNKLSEPSEQKGKTMGRRSVNR